MNAVVTALVIVGLVILLGLAMSARIVKQYEDGVLFRLGRVIGERKPGFRMIIPFVDVMHLTGHVTSWAARNQAEYAAW